MAVGDGADTYLFYASNGVAAVDSAVLLTGLSPYALTLADF